MNRTLFAKLMAFTAFALSLVMLFNVSADGIRYNAVKTTVNAYALDDEDDEIIGYNDFTPDEDEEDLRYTRLLPMILEDSATLETDDITGAVELEGTFLYRTEYHFGLICKYTPAETYDEDLWPDYGPQILFSINDSDMDDSMYNSYVTISEGRLIPQLYTDVGTYYPNYYADNVSFTNLLYAIVSEDQELLYSVLQNPYEEIDTDEIEANLQIDLNANVGLNKKISVNDDNEVSIMSLSGWLTSLIVVAAVIVAYVIVTQVAEQIQAEKNRSYNENLETLHEGRDTIDGLAYGVYIDNQHTSTPANYHFGFTKFGEVGCEVAAIYNLMIDLGDPQMLSQVIYDFEKWAIEYAFAWGNFGSEPRKLYRYLKDKDISYKKYTSYKKYSKAVSVTDSDHYISSFWNSSIFEGLHTFYIRRTLAVTGETTTPFYTPYNHDFEDATTSNFDDFKNSYSSFITGYIILV